MESISVFDMLKISVGPSSSHTMGPWIALQQCLAEFMDKNALNSIKSIQVHLYGSLAKTGPGHGTDKAIMLAISGHSPTNIDCSKIDSYIQTINADKKVLVLGEVEISFNPKIDIIFNKNEQFSFHSNALKVLISHGKSMVYEDVFYSIGGGFVVKGHGHVQESGVKNILPFPIDKAKDLLKWCKDGMIKISEVVRKNELVWRNGQEINNQLQKLVDAMFESIYKGCHSTGILPGGLGVKRRASYQNNKLIAVKTYNSIQEWISCIKDSEHSFLETLNWVSCFALAVNEENASFGRVVTAPTNGAAGVIPSVMLYYLCFYENAKESDLYDFLLVAGELGSIIKKGATISAAMGGCQAEIGVSSAMAAGALTEVMGGTPEQVLMAAEIAMEHHLGLTCDPIGGLVQVPCIERNAMGAIKSITAAQIALASNPYCAKVFLDDVIKTMWQTAEDMNSKYKETSEGGLALNIPVSYPDC